VLWCADVEHYCTLSKLPTPYAQVSFGAEARGYMLARPGTSDADFEAINACFQAPLEGASAFEFMSLRIPGLLALGFRWAVRGFHHDEWNGSSSTVAGFAGIAASRPRLPGSGAVVGSEQPLAIRTSVQKLNN